MLSAVRFSGILFQKDRQLAAEDGRTTFGRFAFHGIQSTPYCFSLQGSDVFAVLSDEDEALKAMARKMEVPAIFVPTPGMDRPAAEGIMHPRSRELAKEWKAKPGEEVVFEALA
jgi:hypothetical protein